MIGQIAQLPQSIDDDRHLEHRQRPGALFSNSTGCENTASNHRKIKTCSFVAAGSEGRPNVDDV
jgi:hypothetical protein